MAERRRFLTAEERLAGLERERSRLRRERLVREVAGARFRRVVRVIPLLFERQGSLEVRRLIAGRTEVIEVLREVAVFALDTALRLTRGHGFLAGGDVHVYVQEFGVVDRLARLGLVEPERHPDAVLVRAWPGPPRLLASVSGHRVVSLERLQRELVGAVGPRADLLALTE